MASLRSSLGVRCGSCPLSWLDYAFVSASRGGSRCGCPSRGVVLWISWVCRASRERCICLVSCSNSPIRHWLVRRSASTPSVLACIVSNAPLGGQLSTSPGWSCILWDWRCFYLYSKLIPSVTERSTLFVKEMSFPQTAPTDDAFFNRNWAGAC